MWNRGSPVEMIELWLMMCSPGLPSINSKKGSWWSIAQTLAMPIEGGSGLQYLNSAQCNLWGEEGPQCQWFLNTFGKRPTYLCGSFAHQFAKPWPRCFVIKFHLHAFISLRLSNGGQGNHWSCRELSNETLAMNTHWRTRNVQQNDDWECGPFVCIFR